MLKADFEDTDDVCIVTHEVYTPFRMYAAQLKVYFTRSELLSRPVCSRRTTVESVSSKSASDEVAGGTVRADDGS